MALKNTKPWESAGIAFNPNDPNSYSYDANALDIKRKQDLAKALAGFEMRKGGITNPGGFYAGGANGMDVLAKVLASIGEAKIQKAADEDAKANDRASMDAYRAAMGMRDTPSEAELSLMQDPAVYKHADPTAVGPTMDELTGAQTTPVKPQSQVVSRPLPPQAAPMQPTQAAPTQRAPAADLPPAQAPIPVPTAPSGPAQAAQREQRVMSLARQLATEAGAPGTDRSFIDMGRPEMQPFVAQARARLNQPTAPQQQPAPVNRPALAPVMAAAGMAPQPQPQAQMELPPAGVPEPTADELAYQQAVDQRANPATDPRNGFVVDESALKGVIKEKQRLERERLNNSEDMLMRSGPRGQALLQAIQAAEMQRIAKGKGDDEFVTTSLGDGQFVTTNKRTGEVVPSAKPDGPSSKQTQQNLENRLKIDGFRTETKTELDGHAKVLSAIDRTEAAITKYGPKFGGALGAARLKAGVIAGEKDAIEFSNALQGLSLDSLKATFGGNTSNTELLELGKQWGADGSVPADVLMNKLGQLRAAALRGQRTQQSRFKNLNREYKAAGGVDDEEGGGTGGTSAPKAPSKSGLDWMPAR